MGIESYLVGASLNGVLSQRLCRRICAKCKQPYEPPKAMLSVIQRMGLESNEFYRGAGCAKCRNTGFSGRIAIHELLVVDDALREAISVSPTGQTVNEYARQSGMIPLRFDGLQKVKEGLTTIEEVLQVSNEGWLPVK
jgi:type IV pilus assembly protein PilB